MDCENHSNTVSLHDNTETEDCPNARPLTFLSAGNIFTRQFACKSWGCPHCRKEKRKTWRKRIKPLLSARPRIWRLTIKTSHWARTYIKLLRHKANYVAIDDNQGNLVVFSDVEIKGWQAMVGAGAAIMACQLIDEAGVKPSGKRPVRTCRKWKLPTPQRAKVPCVRLCGDKSEKMVAEICRSYSARQVVDGHSVVDIERKPLLYLLAELRFRKGDLFLPRFSGRKRYNVDPPLAESWVEKAICASFG